MIKLKCTKKLSSRLGNKPVGTTPSEVSSGDSHVLGDWVGNIIPIMGGELIIFINENSLLTIVLKPTAVDDLQTAFQNQVILLLEYLGISKSFVQEVQSEIASIAIDKTDSRRMLGLLNDASHYYQDSVDFIPPDRVRNQVEMEVSMTDWLFGPSPYQHPINLLSEIVQKHGNQGD